MLPLGGYVQMVGQVDGDESDDGSDDDPRSLQEQDGLAAHGDHLGRRHHERHLRLRGLHRWSFLAQASRATAAVMAVVDSGKPAFKVGLRTGAAILNVNGIEHPYFDNLKYETMESLGKIDITTQRLGIDAKPTNYDITPHQERIARLASAPANKAKLISRKMAPVEWTSPSLAGQRPAKSAFDFDDVIVGITDPADPAKRLNLRPDPAIRMAA